MKTYEKKIFFFNIRFVCALLMSGIIIFSVFSIATYNPYDSSLMFATSENVGVTNACGVLGAHLAALLFYVFGGAAHLIFFPLLFILFMIMSKRTFFEEYDRIIAACCLVIIGSTLLTVYKIDYAFSLCPGGLIGMFLAPLLLHYFDVIGRLLFLYTSMTALFIICWRFSSMAIVRSLIVMVRVCVSFVQRYKVVQRIVNTVLLALSLVIIRPLWSVFCFVQSLCDGSAFDETDFVAIDMHEHEHDNIVLVDEAKYIDETIVEPIQDTVSETVIPQSSLHTKDAIGSAYYVPLSDIFIHDDNEKDDVDLQQELHARASILQDKLKRFGISGEVVAIKKGPVVTLFEYQPDIDTKLSKILVLEDDLAMALQALSIRILAPIPGRSVVGFEVANHKRHDVLFSHIVSAQAYKNFHGALPLVLGKNTIGEPVVVDLACMPHLLIAGSTGSGKSVALNALLMSLLCALSPDELKLILIDPKRLEFASFTDVAHLLFPIVTSPHYAAPILKWVVQEMERRYEKMAEKGVRNCADYNAYIDGHGSNDEHTKLPLIVVVIDELSDLMLTTGRDIEELITRITQMARAAGIHMIVATQRPSVDVITGLIKANFPSRISFRVASRIDSRTILDSVGADRLLGRGDMLFMDASTSVLKRVHGAYVSDQEIAQVVDHIKTQREVQYLDIHKEIQELSGNITTINDPLYDEICLFLKDIDEISISLVQRKFRIGYNRSARIIDILESQGLIMPQEGGKMRKVIRS